MSTSTKYYVALQGRAWGKVRQKIGKCAMRYAIKNKGLYAIDYVMERTIIYQEQPKNHVSIPNIHLNFRPKT